MAIDNIRAEIEAIQEELQQVQSEIIREREKKLKAYKYCFPADKIHQSITADKMPKKGEIMVNLSGRATKKEDRALIIVSLQDFGVSFSRPLTQDEKAILFAVYSLIEAGFTWCTDVMIWRTMNGDSKADPKPEQSKMIDEIIKKLSVTAVMITAVNNAGLDYIGREVNTWENLISIRGIKETKKYKNGTEARYFYRFKGIDNGRGGLEYTPILLQFARDELKQITRFDPEILNIKKLDTKTGELKTLQRNKDRTRMRFEVLEFCNAYNRAKNGGKPFYKMNERDFANIFEACGIENTNRMQTSRNKQYICDVLEHFKRNGMIKDYEANNEKIIIK